MLTDAIYCLKLLLTLICVKTAPSIKISIPIDPINTMLVFAECSIMQNDIFNIPIRSLNQDG